jgi:hypothetical protein
MGRGLSDLQRCILTIAFENRESEGRDPGQTTHKKGADVYRWEIMERFYGWTPPAYARRDGRKPGGKKYRPQQIGPREYAAAQAAVSKAMNRLNNRGLIDIIEGRNHWTGGDLTLEGLDEARKLMAMSCVNPSST